MITVAELRAIPLLAEVPDHELQHLAATVADIRLQAGEYVAHEGDGGALIIVIEGACEVTKFMDGIERVIGARNPGDMFGEVPVVLNTPFLASLRAKVDSRVIRIETPEYHHLAAASPAVSAKTTASALDRVGGLQDLAAQKSEPELIIVGPRWDPKCFELRDFLQRNQVSFEWHRPEEAEDCTPAELAYRKYPVVKLRDGAELVQPSRREVANAVGLSIEPAREEYDVVIVGGGPAGMAAAVYGASEGLHTVLIERQVPGGQAGQSSRIENYLGFPVGVSGEELARRAFQQAKRFGAEIIVTREVKQIDLATQEIELDGGEHLRARTVILALGVAYRRLAVKGGERFTGRGVFYGAARSEAGSTQGQDIYLIGAGNSAGQAALFFANHAKTVTLIVRGDSLAKSMSYYLIEQLKTKANIRVELNSEVIALYGDEHLEAIDVIDRSTGTTTKRPTPALFVFIGADTDTAWLPPEIARDSHGFVLTGADVVKANHWTSEGQPFLLETSVPGIFAAGDIRAGSVKRVAAGVGEGSMAIAFVHQRLQAKDAVARV
ncbi:MAG TPA: FAD-dependent oxidoreductase [Candidatus Binatus sp.]|nr:FAD-dependent oxidoreductase [Candidatus Binatus sp.]